MTRTYMIIKVTDLESVDFFKVCETSPETLYYSLDGTKTFIKWEGEQPAFVSGLTGTEGPYTNSQIRAILSTDAWSDEDEET